MDVRLVVDASVAKGCGERTDFALACAYVMTSIAMGTYRLVWTKPLALEWEKHASRLAVKSLARIRSQRRVWECEPMRINDLHSAIKRAEKDRRAPMRKDAFLVEAAFHTDRRIVSADGRACDHFRTITNDWEPIGLIHWVEPGEACSDWLDCGAIDDKAFQIGS